MGKLLGLTLLKRVAQSMTHTHTHALLERRAVIGGAVRENVPAAMLVVMPYLPL